MHRAFWEPFRLGTSAAVNSVAKLISGTNPKLGFKFKKYQPLLRLVFIHTEDRHVTFARSKIYAGFCLYEIVDVVFVVPQPHPLTHILTHSLTQAYTHSLLFL